MLGSRAHNGRRSHGQLALAAALSVLAVLIVPAGAAASNLRSGHGLQITSVRHLDPRLMAVTVKTAALPDPANVYILLPSGYASHPRRHYPVLYLLDGTSGLASDWTKLGNAEQTIGKRQLITVMPDITLGGNGGGWCTDWPDGAQRWETFHIGQLLPWVDANLRTIRARRARAIAGLSQGGFCSLSYASRHPDLFATAVGYSAAPDIYYDADARVGAQGIINATETGLDGVPPNTFFGDPVTDAINWAAHDPASLANNLRWTHLYMYWGNGTPGPFDTTVSPPASGIEGAVWRDNHDFQARIAGLGISGVFEDYGPGTHSWPYWARDLQWSIGPIMSGFAHPLTSSAGFTYTSADDQYGVYGWQVVMHRTAREFSTLGNAGRAGFSLAGSGSATVQTASYYRPGRRYRVSLAGDRVHAASEVISAGRDHRLTVEVPLGPANPYQQDTALAALTGTSVYTTRVSVTPAS